MIMFITFQLNTSLEQKETPQVHMRLLALFISQLY